LTSSGDNLITVDSYRAFSQNGVVEMDRREGLNFDEEELACFLAQFETSSRGLQGTPMARLNVGELILTQKGIVFIETKGITRSKRVRAHSFDYDTIDSVRSESRGITGSIWAQEFIVIEIDSPEISSVLKYSCHKDDCVRIKKMLEDRVSFGFSGDKFRNELLRILKPLAEANLKQISQMKSIRVILDEILGKKFANQENYLKAVIDMTRSLISEGHLEGVLDKSGQYISRLSLERRHVQYQVSIDFASLFTQLKGKGIVLESLECPSCKGKLQYPETGNMITCNFCGSNVSATDVFEKFKTFLDV
jgi:hypothetical protein